MVEAKPEGVFDKRQKLVDNESNQDLEEQKDTDNKQAVASQDNNEEAKEFVHACKMRR